MKHTAKLLALLIVLGLSGCAGTKDLESVRSQVEQANATADAALRVANEANATAQEARAIAQEANATAQSANATAQEANATSATTEDKIDRMFKKAMYK
jgi:uncharacterized protein HemX